MQWELSVHHLTEIIMSHFERQYIHHIIIGKSLKYFRYIYYIFLIIHRLYIIQGQRKNLINSSKIQIKKHLCIKFYYKAWKDRIVFLETEIYLHNGKLDTKIYRKETDRQHYLHIKFEHPKSWRDSLPFSQTI